MAKSREAFRTISEVADWLGVQSHVLRFWESKFSQVKPVKRAGGRRYYRPQDMELLGGLKKLLHEDGMAIKDAQKLLREKGVKHVAGLSQPVDTDDETLTATAEPVIQPEEDVVAPPEVAAETIEAEAADDTLEAEEVEELSVEEDLSEPVAAEEDETDTLEDALTFDAPEPLAEQTDEEFLAQPELDDKTTEIALTDEQPGEDDEAGIPEGLLVKIEDDVEGPTPEPVEDAAELPIGSPDAQPATPPSAGLEAKEAPNSAQGSSDAPEIGDLFAALETPDPEPEVLDTKEPELQDTSPPLENVDATPVFSTATTASDTFVDPHLDDGGLPASSETTAETDAPPGDLNADPAFGSTRGDDAPTMDAPSASPDNDIESTQPNVSAPVTDGALAEDSETLSPAPRSDADAGLPSEEEREALVAQESTRSDFLLMFSAPVEVASQDKSRAAELLARLEALHSNAI